MRTLSVVFLLAPFLAPAQPVNRDFVRENYTKFEYRIPMRDGVRLFTAVYVPRDASPEHRYPVRGHRPRVFQQPGAVASPWLLCPFPNMYRRRLRSGPRRVQQDGADSDAPRETHTRE